MKFTLNGIPWEIKLVPWPFKDPSGDYVWGMADFTNNVITLVTTDPSKKKLSARRMNQTLMHELVHAIIHARNITGAVRDPATENHNEYIVDDLGLGLEEIFRTVTPFK